MKIYRIPLNMEFLEMPCRLLSIVLCIIAVLLLACGREQELEYECDEYEEYENQIELSEAAIQNYGILTRKVSSGAAITLPRTALVTFKNEHFVYAKSSNEFREIEVSPANVQRDFVTIRNLNLHKDEEIVINGAAYLRIIFLHHRNPSHHGHAH
jgi:hypothetical protein